MANRKTAALLLAACSLLEMQAVLAASTQYKEALKPIDPRLAKYAQESKPEAKPSKPEAKPSKPKASGPALPQSTAPKRTLNNPNPTPESDTGSQASPYAISPYGSPLTQTPYGGPSPTGYGVGGFGPGQFPSGWSPAQAGFAPGQFPPGGAPPQPGYAPGQFPSGGAPPQPGYAPGHFPSSGAPPQPGFAPGQFPPGGAPPQAGFAPGQFPPGGAPPPPGYAPGQFPSSGSPPPPGYAPGQFPSSGSPPQPGYVPGQLAPAASSPPSTAVAAGATPPVVPGSLPPAFPPANLIPEFARPLPQAPDRPQYNLGPGWGAGPAAPGPIPVDGRADSSREEQNVARMEQVAFGTTYPEHELEDRVEHLEIEVLGGKDKSDLPIPDRIGRLAGKLGTPSAFGTSPSTSISSATPGQLPPPSPTQTRSYPPAPSRPSDKAPPKPPISTYGLKPPVAALPRSAGSTQTPDSGASPEDSSSVQAVVGSIPEQPNAGDYFAQITRFDGGSVARWTGFPVLIHLPQATPDGWSKILEGAIAKWNQYVPIRVAAPSEPADVEVAWINHLPPRQLGLTNLEIFNGRMRVTVYLLRPSYYLPTTPEKTLSLVALHEFGHVLGLFGHSADPRDAMYPVEAPGGKASSRPRTGTVTARDLNTLKKVYKARPLPPGYQSPHPMGWAFHSKS